MSGLSFLALVTHREVILHAARSEKRIHHPESDLSPPKVFFGTEEAVTLAKRLPLTTGRGSGGQALKCCKSTAGEVVAVLLLLKAG